MMRKYFFGVLLLSLLLFSFSLSFPIATQAAQFWDDSVIPATESFNDTNPNEVGVKFNSSVDGYITGLRFYKGASNTGIHYGTLWTGSGTKLADAIFTGETASGWQTVSLTKPVKITANTTYVVSYFTGVGYYSFDPNYFTNGYDNSPLHALSTVEGGNGIFRTNTEHAFPNGIQGSAGNFWVDLVFLSSVTAPSTTGDGPILVITSTENNFTTYLPEIMRAEGMNAFATADISNVSASTLDDYDMVVLGEMPLTVLQANAFSDWVTDGGNLIAMRPDSDLALLLGLTSAGSTLTDGYMLVNTASAPGTGITAETIQYHSTADRYTLSGATSIATLYSNASTATANPAVTIRSVGSNGGQAAAFMYDLAKSVIYTRQGNPAYENQERDGEASGIIRPNDLFFPTYLDLNKAHIPQADEQQRLLANMILMMNLDKKPLPRFWYLPSKKKAVMLYAIDDHATGDGTKTAFNILVSNSDVGCSVEDWECLRGTSWLYSNSGLTNAEAGAFYAQGFQFGVHAVGCSTCSPAQYDTSLTSSLNAFQTKYTSIPPQTTHRFHQIPWTDWISHARVERTKGIRFDMNYYYFPAEWTGDKPGFMTGSGMPMKFAGIDGSVVDVYQQDTDFTNDNALVHTQANIAEVIDRALGSEGYYGVFGTHDDRRDTATLSAYLNVVLPREVSMVSAEQVLAWTDGRNASTLDTISWSNNVLSFTITAASGSRNMHAMLPVNSISQSLTSIKRGVSTVTYTTETIKGIDYAFFPATTGSYTARYGLEPTATPIVTPTTAPSQASSTANTSSSSGSDPNFRLGWNAIISAGPNFIGNGEFISGMKDAHNAMIFIGRDASPIDLTVSINKAYTNDLAIKLLTNPFPWMQGFNTVSEIFEFKALSAFNGYPLDVFDKPVTVTLPYYPERLFGISPNRLRIAWYDLATSRWKILENNTVINTSNNTIANTTKKLSYFVVVYRAGSVNGSRAVQGASATNSTNKKIAQNKVNQAVKKNTQNTQIKSEEVKNKTCLFGWCW